MLKKTIEYVDYNGETRKEEFYFNFSKAEVGDLQFSTPGGLQAHIERIMNTADVVEIHKLFKEIVLKSYGEKSPDGKYFLKYDDNGNSLGLKFSQSEAYSQLYMELIMDQDTISAFINAVVPEFEDPDKPVGQTQQQNRQNIIPLN